MVPQDTLTTALFLVVSAVTPHATFVRGPVNGLLIRQKGKVLAVYGDPRDKPARVERVLFTHHRRDVAWAGRGAEAVVPEREKQLFTDVKQYWDRQNTARFHDYAQQGTKVLTEPLRNVTTVRGGERIDFEGLPITVLDTPGYTRGAVSYLVELDGKRIACTGDLIYGDGKILDLYSLQDAIPEAKEDGYHGYAARAGDVIASLRKIVDWNPDVLVPARGPLIDHPRQAIDKLTRNLQAVFASHFAIDALRWYRGDERLRTQAGRVLGTTPVDWMPMAEQQKLPDWIVAIANSRLILSQSGAAFLVDCGNRRILDQVKQRVKSLDGIYLTHYHDDHTDQVQTASDEFHCPVFVSAEMRDILERPAAYRMPAQTANPIRNLVVFKEGEKRRWHEFEFTYSWFPGQTLYHDGLVVKKDGGETVFFVGDSFTPSGVDDYCLLNRNFVAPEKGFLYCLNVLKQMKPGYLLINQHVAPAFRFSPQQIDRMIDNFEKRAALFSNLFPWDDPNFGLDEQWARFYPYATDTPAELKFAILNHSPAQQRYRITPHVPAGWKAHRVVVSVPPRLERLVSIPVTPAPGARGLHVITADVAFGPWDLRGWAEGMVTLTAAPASRASLQPPRSAGRNARDPSTGR